MRIGVLPAVAVAILAASAVAQAATISATLAGTIYAGSNGGTNGADDVAGLFGGSNLFGASVIISFSYDTDLLNSAVVNHTNGSSYTPSAGAQQFEEYLDLANDGAVTVSATIAGHTVIATSQLIVNDSSTYAAGYVVSCRCGQNSLQLLVQPENFSTFPQLSFEITLTGTTELPAGVLLDPAAIQAFIKGSELGQLSGRLNLSVIGNGSEVNEALFLNGIRPAQDTSFVATTGDDRNSCSASAYCRSFARALVATNPGGDIVVMDSGGFGPATITQPVSITAIEVDGAISMTAGNALTINTTGDVTLTGLNLDGDGTGNNGILVQSVGILRLRNVQIQNFANNGIEFTASGNLAVYDSKVNDSGHDGLLLENPSAKAYVHNTAFDNNAFAGADSAAGDMTIVDSSAHYNLYGFYADGGTVALQHDLAIFNTNGIAASGTGKLYFADCLLSDNTTAWSATAGGTIAASNPGTSLITPGQGTVGTLSAPIVLP